MSWLYKKAQVNSSDIIRLIMSGGNITNAMIETLQQIGSSICGELNTAIRMSGGLPRERLLKIQRIMCIDVENIPNMQQQQQNQNVMENVSEVSNEQEEGKNT